MKKKLICTFLLLFIVFVGGIIYSNNVTPRIYSGDTLSPSSQNIAYIDYANAVLENHTIQLVFYRSVPSEDLALSIEYISSFTLSSGNQTIYTCTEQDLSRTIYVIPLEDSLWENNKLSLTIQTPYLRRLTSLSIGSLDALSAKEEQHDILIIFYICCQLVLLFICTILYLAKPTEKYLLSLGVLLLVSLLSRGVSNELVNHFFSHATNKILMPVLGLFPLWMEFYIFIRLTNLQLKAPYARYLHLQTYIILTVFTCFLAYMFPDSTSKIMYSLANLLSVLTVLLLWLHSTPPAKNSFILVSVYAMNLGILWSNSYVNLYAPVRTLASYSLTGIAFLIYSLGACVFVLLRFASKFSESEKLTMQLEQLNVQLDEKATQRARELVDEKAQKHRLMLNVFHDLRTPLYISGECINQLTASDASSDSEQLTILKDQLDFMNRLTEDLFLIAKMEDHDFLLVMDRVDISVLCQEQCQAASVMASSKEIQLTWHITPGLIIWGDSFRLEQTLQNLLTNAITYTPIGGSVTLSLHKKALSVQDNGTPDFHTVLRISDTGKGISSDDLPYIFERYYRVDRADNKKSTGLGLSIAHEIIKIHRGTLNVESQLGSGTTFTATLPLLEI